MKFLRVGEFGKETPAVLDNENKIRDLSKIIKDFNPENLNFKILDKIKKKELKSLPQLDNNQRIGVEHEKFLFNKSDFKRIDYEKIKKVFEILKDKCW